MRVFARTSPTWSRVFGKAQGFPRACDQWAESWARGADSQRIRDEIEAGLAPRIEWRAGCRQWWRWRRADARRSSPAPTKTQAAIPHTKDDGPGGRGQGAECERGVFASAQMQPNLAQPEEVKVVDKK